jgi:branched-chain amino acid transport system substrate-binding protein
MPRKRLSRLAVVLAGLMIAALVGWPALAALPRQAAQTFNVGIIGPFSSPAAQGVFLALEQANANETLFLPGNRPFKLDFRVIEARTPEEVGSAISRLKQENVVAIIGPDNDTLATGAQAALAGARLPVFVGATGNSVKVGGNVFRAQAVDSVQMGALAAVLTDDLKQTNIAVFEGNNAVKGAVEQFVRALAGRGINPTTVVLRVPNSPITESVKVLLDSKPEVVAAFSDAADVADLYRALRAGGYNGILATPEADNRAFIGAVAPPLRTGVYGVSGWSYTLDTPESVAFTRAYVNLFGKVPNGQSAAAYDATNVLIAAMQAVGTDPEALRARIANSSKAVGVQGPLSATPANGELSVNAAVVVSGRFGAAQIVARFSGDQRLPDLGPVTATLAATPTRTPTPTPEGVIGTVKTATLNIRTGPSTVYPTIGTLRKDETVQLIGANANFTWYVILFRGQQAWIFGESLTIFGDRRTLPIFQPPPTPTPSPTPTPLPLPDIVLANATMNPPVPQPNVPMNLLITVKNQGTAPAGQFAVATAFDPGQVFASAIVNGLAPGQSITVTLTGTVTGTGVPTIAIVLDLNSQVNEGPTGEANNKPEFTYRVDKPYVATGTIAIPAPSGTADLFGGTADLQYSGGALIPINGTLLGVLPGVQLPQVHRDFLSPDKINVNVGIPNGQIPAGMLIGIYTAEGNRGVMRVVQNTGAAITLEYYIYAN